MYVSATDREKLGLVATFVYTSSTEDVLAFLMFMYAEISCFVSVFSSFYFYWNSFGILKGPLQQKKTIFSVYGVLDKPIEEKYRYTAYRQFVRWCWGYLGKNIRVPLPSCVTAVIRQKYNSPDYVGFKYSET